MSINKKIKTRRSCRNNEESDDRATDFDQTTTASSYRSIEHQPWWFDKIRTKNGRDSAIFKTNFGRF